MQGPSAKPLIIAGGGLAGCLAALALAVRRPDVNLLLIEAGPTFGGNHTWSWFASDLESRHRWLTELFTATRWQEHEVRFPARRRRLGGAYGSLTSAELDRVVRTKLQPGQFRLNASLAAVAETEVRLQSGERIEASAVIDARGWDGNARLDLAWQKFLGIRCRFERPHELAIPMVMDASVDQSFGYRFVYTLPFSPTELLIEDTYYSTQPAVDAPRLRRHIEDYARDRGWGRAEPLAEEVGVLPIPLGGRLEQWWPEGDGIARIGVRGGFFHPTTGYSLPDAVANAALLAEQDSLSSPALHHLFRRRADRLWGERAFYRLLNRMLFEAAPPRQRYRVLEHFYRLPEPVISRFYAGRTSWLDRLRILSGRPPVPVRPALAAAWRRA